MNKSKPWIRPGESHPEDMPWLGRRLWNVSHAMLDFLADGCRTLDRESYQARLETCNACSRRKGDQCLVCGCHLSVKARGRAFQCPQGRWEKIKTNPKDGSEK